VFLALAFADDAFELFTMDILDTIAPAPGKDAIKILYKSDMLKVPVFCKVGKDATTPWSTNDFREILQKIGLRAGFDQTLTPYHFKRGCAAAIQGNADSYYSIGSLKMLIKSGKTSKAQRNQILGHKGSTVIQFYMPELVGFDTQGCYLGNPSTELLDVYSHMSL